MGRLLILFILIPAIELMLLVQIGRRIGIVSTIAVIVFTGFLGAYLARRQGLKVWRQLQKELSQGRPPAATIVEGVLVLVAGAVLMTPGVLTDAFGLALLIPPCRRALQRWLFGWFKRAAASGRGTVFVSFGGRSPRGAPPPPGQGPIYDIQPEKGEEETGDGSASEPPRSRQETGRRLRGPGWEES